MNYILTQHQTINGVLVAQGSVLSTEAPQGSLFRLETQEAEALEAEGILAPYTPPAEPACLEERGWSRIDIPAWDRSEDRAPS